ncbi:MAG: glycosyltransferase family 4 protein [Ignavibacteriaceae bacterium]
MMKAVLITLYQIKIFLETTLVDVELVKDIDIEKLMFTRFNRATKTILFLSRIERSKGIYEILDIFKKLNKSEPDYKLIFAGDGMERENLQNEILRLNIENVYLKGFVKGEEKKRLFEEASLFMFLSESEGMSNAVLEAMSFGLPVVTTNVGGIASVFQNNINGILIEKNNFDNILDKIHNIMSNKGEYLAISRENYYTAKEKFWSNVVAKRIIEIFDEISYKNNN